MTAFLEQFGGIGLAFLGAALAVGLCCVGSARGTGISSNRYSLVGVWFMELYRALSWQKSCFQYSINWPECHEPAQHLLSGCGGT